MFNKIDKNMKNNFVLWIMGPTSSGKTTLAKKLLLEIRKNGNLIIHYDGDEVRNYFGPKLGYEESDRMRVVKTISHLSNKALDSGLNVIVSALTANLNARTYVKNNVKNLILVSVECCIEKCAQRDPKGLYEKAQNGEIKTLIGFNSEYLPPENPHIVINTETSSIRNSLAELLKKISQQTDLQF